ncbi:hypothetical protein B0A48_15540 [Cryoendolithus antarcticus]|uniref:Ribonucleases P/MRP subunit Pop8-like domain-containing protein n=1 Tax=Cryoendolithus antarcticus TaxID=1507870 RepID=A0A1V8SGI6_9PEZI|nr:hypothetical protein B0A48_15540 [Cryoendolithus antarcticus]
MAEDVAMAEAAVTAPTQPATQTSTASKKRVRTPKTQTLANLTLRNPQWSYIHLSLVSAKSPSSSLEYPPLDALTAHLHLTSALSQFLGLHGGAIPIDILKLEGQDVWIRIPADDRVGFVAATGGWTGRGGEGWRIVGWSSWSADASGRDGGRDLFGD